MDIGDNQTHTDMSSPLIEDRDVEFFGDVHDLIPDKPGGRSVRLSVYELYAKSRRDVLLGGALSLVIVVLFVFITGFDCGCDEGTYTALGWTMLWIQLYAHVGLYIAYRTVRSEIEVSGLSTIELTLDHK